MLTAWDAETFAAWCDAVARRRRAAGHLERDGEVLESTVYDRNGQPTGTRLVRNPWTLVLSEADAEVQRYAARFGLTPGDRAHLKIAAPDRAPGDDLLSN